MPIWLRLVIATAVFSGAPDARAQDLTVAAASDLQPVLPELAARFERESGLHARLTFGSSGNVFAQIQNGAPIDLFLSADIAYPRRLEQAGLTEPGTLTRYAVGRLVLWTRADSGIDLRQGLRALLQPGVRRIAIANPAHAPYGQAAVAALEREGFYERVREKFVLGENVSQAAQFAQSGNAEVGFIALSLARSPALESGVYVEVPASLHPPIEQGGVVVRSSRQKAAAKRFLAFLTRAETTRWLVERGFGAPAPVAP